MEKWQSLF